MTLSFLPWWQFTLLMIGIGVGLIRYSFISRRPGISRLAYAGFLLLGICGILLGLEKLQSHFFTPIEINKKLIIGILGLISLFTLGIGALTSPAVDPKKKRMITILLVLFVIYVIAVALFLVFWI